MDLSLKLTVNNSPTSLLASTGSQSRVTEKLKKQLNDWHFQKCERPWWARQMPVKTRDSYWFLVKLKHRIPTGTVHGLKNCRKGWEQTVFVSPLVSGRMLVTSDVAFPLLWLESNTFVGEPIPICILKEVIKNSSPVLVALELITADAKKV